jgi:DNA (cytosine-5)-methyltransferase 1
MVLSLFPGIGLLDRAFEEAGFCVVRGPDLLWGGDVREFHPPAGVFAGVIGGPPCQAHSTYAQINRAQGNRIAPDLIPEYVRCVEEARPTWWLAENVPGVPDIDVPGYVTTSTPLDTRWLGEPQSRLRRFQFGTEAGLRLNVETVALENPEWESACLASEGKSGRMSFRHRGGKPKTTYSPRRPFPRFCELQGLPSDYLASAPFTVAGKYKAVGNGVPLPMGRAIARAVKHALAQAR